MYVNEKQNTSSGIGFSGVLGIVFIVLKLCRLIDWPWVWVLAPIWGSIALSVLILAVMFGVAIWQDKH